MTYSASIRINMKSKIILIFSVLLINTNLIGGTIFEWGSIKAEFAEIAPQYFVGTAQSPATEIRKFGRLAFGISKDMEIVNDIISCKVFINQFGSGHYKQLQLDSKIYKLDLTKGENLIQIIKPMDELLFDFITKSGEHYSLRLVALKEPQGYIQPLFIPTVKGDEIFDYQLVTLRNKSQVLKIDTTLATNSSILTAYRKLPKVRIVHMPDFKSTTNYLSETDTVLMAGKRPVNLHVVQAATRSFFPETIELAEINKGKPVLEWSKMTANPDSPLFSLSYAKRESYRDIVFKLGDKVYNIVSLRMTYYNDRDASKTYYVENLQQMPLDNLKNASEPLSIIFDQIILKERGIGYIYVPQAFIFNFE